MDKLSKRADQLEKRHCTFIIASIVSLPVPLFIGSCLQNVPIFVVGLGLFVGCMCGACCTEIELDSTRFNMRRTAYLIQRKANLIKKWTR